MPVLDCHSQVKVTNGKLQKAIRHNVEELTEIPELELVSSRVLILVQYAYHESGPGIFVAKISSMSSSSMYGGDYLENEVYSEEHLQHSMSTIRCKIASVALTNVATIHESSFPYAFIIHLRT